MQLVLLVLGFPLWCVWEWCAFWFSLAPRLLHHIHHFLPALRAATHALQRMGWEFAQSLYWYGFEQYFTPACEWAVSAVSRLQAWKHTALNHGKAVLSVCTADVQRICACHHLTFFLVHLRHRRLSTRRGSGWSCVGCVVWWCPQRWR